MTDIHGLPTPALLLDLDVLDANIARMAGRAADLGVFLRPHIKTHKCIEIGERQREHGAQGIAVSTIPEARAFAAHGFDDVTWAYPVQIGRIDEARALADRITFRLTVDTCDAVAALDRAGIPFHVWLKVDCGYHRAGVDPTAPYAIEVAQAIHESAILTFDGLLTHAGHAYKGPSLTEARAAAIEERDVSVAFADRLRSLGIEVPTLSVGSTPGMVAVDHLDGVSEARPGNYVFHDHTQVLLGSCSTADCALTVLASVISAQPGAGHCVTDAGALALSKDTGRGTGARLSMGEIFDDYAAGTLRQDARLISLSQEHGIASASITVGSRLRILPNHACLTAPCFDKYHVVQGERVVDAWRVHRERC
jgi:D-serine deaminase-like pyridoxal phosphate-dependent protein